ncbi:hypothetical protein AQUCO_01400716v1 [Aquilegia coerulea]|uniref:Uncharacterized protein n=1 Tax=Aquilegia coerulea TaxID=218851 RepID=A0A2G5DXR7_AQUCA|nr:hypothetical protein AQUCO_01400716v1 [Aquilegia coerulea]PIA48302.1 hypothetical protein AQUCO_01400716v1 [Aquilegia coerulea]
MEAATSFTPDDFTSPNDELMLKELQNTHTDQLARIQELKSKLESIKSKLESMKLDLKKESSEERKELFRNLTQEYIMERDEYKALIAKSKNLN